MTRVRLDDPRNYFNRHESWLAFNRRVLEQAQDESNPCSKGFVGRGQPGVRRRLPASRVT